MSSVTLPRACTTTRHCGPCPSSPWRASSQRTTVTTPGSRAATATSTSSASARCSAGAGCARNATSCSWRWRRSCRSRGWSRSSAATCSTTRHRPAATTRCSNSRTTSRSNASAKVASRARPWPRWCSGRNGARMRWCAASNARSCRTSIRASWRSRRCWSCRASTGFRRRCGSSCVHASPTDIDALAGKRVALWGWGREGRAAWRALHGRGIAPLALFCNASEAKEALALDAALHIEPAATAERAAACDVVVQSPGSSPYQPDAPAAAAMGTRLVGGTAWWFGTRAGDDGVVANAVCIPGTQGKSTSTAMQAHVLRAAGARTALAGNIGMPLLELLDADPQYWAIELSSYQTGDVADSGARPQVAVALNVFPEHLDWHGSHERYVADKLRLLTDARPRMAVLNAQDPRLAALRLPDSDVRWFNHAEGWHLRGDALHRGEAFVLDTAALPLPGRHNRGNLCAVLTAIEALGLDAVALAPHAASFQPLPHRLQVLGLRDRIAWVNDSISTTPHATLAALDVYR